MNRFWNVALLSAALLVPITIAPTVLQAAPRVQVRIYHDNRYNDNHEWNEREARAHRLWEQENHRRHREFERYRENDRQAYWGWRHDHSDDVLRIQIH